MAESTPTERAGSCTVCRTRDPEFGLVCEPCRAWLPTALRSVADMYPRLRDMLEPQRRGGQRVAGTRDKPVPVNVTAVDLLGPVVRDGGRPVDVTGDNWVPKFDTQPREVWVSNGHKGPRRATVLDRKPARDEQGRTIMVPAGDQVGQVPVAVVLDQEVRAWADSGAPGSRWRPVPTVPALVAWMIRRVDWACDYYRGIDATAEALRRLRGQMMSMLGEFDPDPQHCNGVACKRCDRQSLYVRPDGSGDVDCVNEDCLKVYSADEYASWVEHNAAYERSRRTPEEVAAILRRGPRDPA